ncbi:MAG: hypothetical protein ACRC0J_18885 [Shewanella oncorhynchi]
MHNKKRVLETRKSGLSTLRKFVCSDCELLLYERESYIEDKPGFREVCPATKEDMLASVRGTRTKGGTVKAAAKVGKRAPKSKNLDKKVYALVLNTLRKGIDSLEIEADGKIYLFTKDGEVWRVGSLHDENLFSLACKKLNLISESESE